MHLLRILEIIVGAVLLYGGMQHASNPFYFAASIAAYQLVPIQFLWAVPPVMSSLMIVTGYCVLEGRRCELARRVAAILFCCFALAQIISLSNGQQISCGCFGNQTNPISAFSISVPVVCGLVCFGNVFFESRRFSGTRNHQHDEEPKTTQVK